MINFTTLEKTIGVKFNSISHLKNAFTHRSFLNESNEADIESNERLEFLGDAILQFLSTEYIYIKFPKLREGELTNLRAKIVNTESLAEESAKLSLSDYLRISKGEKETASDSRYILANVFESLIGAIFLDQGVGKCRIFLTKFLLYKATSIVESGTLKDPKSIYQELAQDKHSTTPTYRVISENGPDHNKNFTVGLYLENRLISTGTGNSKKKAQQEAAQKAVEDLN